MHVSFLKFGKLQLVLTACLFVSLEMFGLEVLFGKSLKRVFANHGVFRIAVSSST